MKSNSIFNFYQFVPTFKYSIFGLSFLSIYLGLAAASWGENIPISPISVKQSELAQLFDIDPKKEPITVPPDRGQTISEIEVRFVDAHNLPVTGKTKTKIILQEFDLQPGDIYDSELALEGLERVNRLNGIKRANITLEESTTDNRTVMVVTAQENPNFFFGFALTLPHPSALKGPARPVTVLPLSNRTSGGISGGIRFGASNLGGINQALSLGIEAGTQTLGIDLDYRDWFRVDHGYGINVASRQGRETPFNNGKIEVQLPDGDDIWIQRTGGGVEFFFPVAQDFEVAVGSSYQLVSARDGLFSSSLEPVDELGNPLTFSDNGQDPLLTLNLAGALDKRNNRLNPTQGYRLLFEMEQAIPIADIVYNRLAANYSYFLPLDLFGFTEGDRTLVLNAQGGTVLGDLPPYQGFNIGGSGSVRGFDGGEAGTGRSFVQATAEYRFPIFRFNAFGDRGYTLGGNLFVDYATNLGSQDAVKGQPGIVRDKPGHGLGFGLGLRLPTSLGTLRLEVGFNDDGGSAVNFIIGESF